MLRILRSIAGPAPAAGLALLVASAGAQSARGEAMGSGGPGEVTVDFARAQVQGYDESTTKRGVGSASATGRYVRDFVVERPGSGGATYRSSRTNDASARVSEDPSRWLEVRSANDGPSIPDPNAAVIQSPGASNSSATASSYKDHILLTPAPGQSPEFPAFLRLNFRVLSGTDEASALGGLLTVRVNEQVGHLAYGNSSSNAFDATSQYLAPGETPLAFDDIDPYTTDGPKAFSFHYDLPAWGDGMSTSLTVSLTAKANERNGGGGDGPGSFGAVPLSALALDSITLPDGSTPESRGYSLAFGSGLRSPNAVPEPASVLVWGVAGAAAFGLARRRRGRSAAR